MPRPSEAFVMTPSSSACAAAPMAYLAAGYPVHLAGPSGIGKTTLAFHLAAALERPAVLIHGNHEFASSDLVGSNSGYKRSAVVDNFIHTVLKTEEEVHQIWVDNRLARACREGHTLIYDEFNRTSPEANNILLSVLEEGILSMPGRQGRGFSRVHPHFRAILTSNPTEYAGTHATQDALMDRLITIHLRAPSADTEAQIAAERAEVSLSRARRIVDLVRHVRALDPQTPWPSLRASVAIATVLADYPGDLMGPADSFVTSVCQDILLSSAAGHPPSERAELAAEIRRYIAANWHPRSPA